jgi:hypothetical protein
VENPFEHKKIFGIAFEITEGSPDVAGGIELGIEIYLSHILMEKVNLKLEPGCFFRQFIQVRLGDIYTGDPDAPFRKGYRHATDATGAIEKFASAP